MDRAVTMPGETLSKPIPYELEVGIGIRPATNLPAGDRARRRSRIILVVLALPESPPRSVYLPAAAYS